MNLIPRLPRIEITAIDEITENRPAAVVTSGPAWAAVDGALRLPVVCQIQPDEATEEAFARLLADVPREAEVVYAVGGGLAIDAAKYIANGLGRPLVGVPTALSVDAFLTAASGVRRDGCVRYVQTGPAEVLFIDWDLIGAAPVAVRAAGVCDLLSIATALWDWRFAESEGRLSRNTAVSPFIAATAEAILDEALLLCPGLGRGEVPALQRLLLALGIEVQICNLLGHSRPEEGSEHYFAYSVENLGSSAFTHADLVGPGIVAMGAAQGQQVGQLSDALHAAGLSLHKISEVAAERTLRELPEYATRHGLPFGIAHVLDENAVAKALQALW